jgi:hypothetical protein
MSRRRRGKRKKFEKSLFIYFCLFRKYFLFYQLTSPKQQKYQFQNKIIVVFIKSNFLRTQHPMYTYIELCPSSLLPNVDEINFKIHFDFANIFYFILKQQHKRYQQPQKSFL